MIFLLTNLKTHKLTKSQTYNLIQAMEGALYHVFPLSVCHPNVLMDELNHRHTFFCIVIDKMDESDDAVKILVILDVVTNIALQGDMHHIRMLIQ